MGGCGHVTDNPILQKPLSGRTVLIACSAKKMPDLVAGIQAMGGNAMPLPVIEAQDIDDKQLLDKALTFLQHYAWILFTSTYGVSFFMKRLDELGIALHPHAMPRICAIGPATAKAVKESGLNLDLIPEEYIAEGVVEALRKYHGSLEALKGHRVLLPRAMIARELLPEALSKSGILVDVVPCYQTVRLDPDAAVLKQLKEKKTDLVLFTSSSGVRNLVDILGEEDGKRFLTQCTVAVIGPITYTTAESFGKQAEILPKKNTIDSLLQAIHEYYSSRKTTVRDRR
jgi:uroporphyrinogen III methyltransferase / synthase